jgi:hypothetical protein
MNARRSEVLTERVLGGRGGKAVVPRFTYRFQSTEGIQQ